MADRSRRARSDLGSRDPHLRLAMAGVGLSDAAPALVMLFALIGLRLSVTQLGRHKPRCEGRIAVSDWGRTFATQRRMSAAAGTGRTTAAFELRRLVLSPALMQQLRSVCYASTHRQVARAPRRS